MAQDGSLISAVQRALERNPQLAAAGAEVSLRSGALLSEEGRFDRQFVAGLRARQSSTPLLDAQRLVSGIDAVKGTQFEYTAGTSQTLRSGVVVNPAVTVVRPQDPLSNPTAPASANVGLNLSFPLMRGRGEAVTTAFERAAALQRDAAVAQRMHLAASLVAQTALAYWNHVAALDALAIRQKAVLRAQTLLEDAKRLSRRDEIPASDIRTYESNLLAARAAVSAAELTVVEARTALMQTLGTPSAIEEPTDKLPYSPETQLLPSSPEAAAFALAQGLSERRNDLRALANSTEAAEVLVMAGRDSLKPQLSLELGVGYGGLSENRSAVASLAAVGQRIAGPNLGLGLNYTLPIENRVAQGQLIARLADVERLRLDARALELQALANLRFQIEQVVQSARQLQFAIEDIVLTDQMVHAQRKLYTMGMSTALNVAQIEERFTQAQLQRLSAQRSLAQSKVLTRLESGTLLSDVPQSSQSPQAALITMESLTSMPAWQAVGATPLTQPPAQPLAPGR